MSTREVDARQLAESGCLGWRNPFSKKQVSLRTVLRKKESREGRKENLTTKPHLGCFYILLKGHFSFKGGKIDKAPYGDLENSTGSSASLEVTCFSLKLVHVFSLCSETKKDRYKLKIFTL